MSKFPKDPAVSNPFTSEKPYQTKKRTIVCNMVRNIIYGDLATRAASLAHGKKVLSKVATHLVLTPGKNSRQSSPKDQEPPKSAASTPKHSRLFLPRKQSHESLTPVDTSSRNSASGEPPPSAKDSSSNPRRDNGKLTIKNITVRRAPSLGVDSRKISEKLGSLLGARKASKNQQQQRADAEGKKRSPVVTINGEKIGKVTVVGIVGGIGTTESSTATGSFVRFNDAVGQEREKLIQYNRMYFSQNGEFPETTLEYYKMVKLIGKGAFGKVALAIHKLTGKYVAIKTIEKDHLKDEFSRRKVLREIYIMKKIKHVNVIRLLEVFESAKQVLMVMEYAGGGDLLHYVRQKKYLTEAEARPIFRQVVYGLAHIHSRNVLHRDIKLDNILLDGEGGVKICDFGVSKIIDKHKSINDQCGTPAYIAPEIISNLVFQLYVIMPILGVQGLLRGSLEPGSAAICDAVRHGALQGAQHERTACADTGGHLWLPGAAVRSYVHDANVSIDARSLIDGLLKLNPRERLSIPEILAHPWLEQELDEDSDEYNYYIVRNEKVADEPSNAPPTINTLNIENLFFQNRPHVRLLFKDYCYIANDFYTHHIGIAFWASAHGRRGGGEDGGDIRVPERRGDGLADSGRDQPCHRLL